MQVTDRQSTCARVENPSDCEVFFFFNARVTSWLHVWVGIRQEGVIPCRMVPSMWDEVHGQLLDVTGRVQHVLLCLPCKDARGASCRTRIVNLKRFNLVETKRNKPRFRVNMISRGRGAIPPCAWAQDKTLVRGMVSVS